MILAIDQGTSATKCLLVDRAGGIVARGSASVGETHPRPGWVEQDATALWRSVQAAVAACLDGQDARAVAAVGIASQRESVVLWDAASGEPVTPLLSWQDQRAAAVCDRLRGSEVEAMVRVRSGLPLDPMFSAAKASWLLDAHDPGRAHTRPGGWRLGTVDAWLLSRFGAEHLIEAGNASRTQLLDVARVRWDHELLDLFGVPAACLPRVVASTGPFPAARGLAPLPDGVPVLAVMGDSHAALYAHGVRAPGQVKATYGTGSSVMGLLAAADRVDPGLCLTIAWQSDHTAFAAEGNIRASGATLRWLANLFGRTPEEISELGAVNDNGGVALVPGFTGLGAPWWDRHAVGLLANLRLDTAMPNLARAALDAVVHQVADVLEAFGDVDALFADGGPTRSDALMRMQADVLGIPVSRANDTELSALGAAHMAGLGVGLWSEAELAALPRARDVFRPGENDRMAERGRWREAVARARGR